MKTEIPGPLVHFFGFHMFFYVIGLSCLAWFHLHFSTELDGEPLQLALHHAWPLAVIFYAPFAIYLFRLPPTRAVSGRRLAKYALGLGFASFLTAAASAGYLGLSYLAGLSTPTAVAVLTQPATRKNPVAVYQVTSETGIINDSAGKFRVSGMRQHKHLELFRGWTGYYFWADRKF